MVDEARLEAVGSGLAPVIDGWFTVNARDAAWLTNEAFGARCVFEASPPVLRRRPDLAAQTFAELGVTLAVVWPGGPSGLYHAESKQEDFLVLAGECRLLVNGEERRLRAWDFFHSPAGTEHVIVGAGEGRSIVLAVGTRHEPEQLRYPVSELAARYGASAEADTTDPREAYARFERPRPDRPEYWDELPWA
jgi:uncharacterized cupin superfamily protein